VECGPYVRGEVEKALALGVIARWTPDMGRPTVINGLRVVVSNRGRKLRLCMNPMYPNLFMHIPSSHYDTIQNVYGFVRKGDWLITTDDTSAYLNLPHDPAMYPIAAFEIDSKLFYFRVYFRVRIHPSVLDVHRPEAEGVPPLTRPGLGPRLPYRGQPGGGPL
jgi:hypothetical protein